MSTSLTFNGTSYSIPAAGEINWSALSTFLIDVGNNAQTTNFQKWATRTVTATATIAATDCIVFSNITTTSQTLNLPAASTVSGRVFVIVDVSGTMATNTVTVDPNGAETINGSATYSLNQNREGIIISSDGSSWYIMSHFTAAADVTYQAEDGTVSLPGYTFRQDTNTGLYRQAADVIGVTVGGTEKLRVTANGAEPLVNAAGTGGFGNVFSGTYTPTSTPVSNITSATTFLSSYIRVGNVVFVGGVIDIVQTAAGSSSFTITVPITNTNGNTRDAYGHANAGNLNAGLVNAIDVRIDGMTSTTTVTFSFASTVAVSNPDSRFMFQYYLR